MKLIDDKGRLFGKINVIDLLVILFLLGLTPIFYYGYKIATYKPPTSTAPPQKLEKTTYKEFEVMFSNIPKEFLPLVQAGNKEYQVTRDKNNKVLNKKLMAEIVKIISKESSTIKSVTGEVDEVMENFIDLKVLLKLLVIPAKDHFAYKGSALKINSVISFSTDKYVISGFIPPPPPPPTREISVTVQINNLLPGVASIIKKGDKEFSFEKKIKVAEISGIVKTENTKTIKFYEGVIRKVENPFYRDVTLDINIIAEQIKDEYFFQGKPVKMGGEISFSTKKYSLTGTIIDILIK